MIDLARIERLEASSRAALPALEERRIGDWLLRVSGAQLSDIVVAPAACGRGVGRRLVAGLLGWARAQGCDEAILQVLASNAVARRLYRSLGLVDAYPYHYRVRR